MRISFPKEKIRGSPKWHKPHSRRNLGKSSHQEHTLNIMTDSLEAGETIQL
jgi:hypothetical protein